LPFPESPVFFNPFRCTFHRVGGEPAAVHAPIFSPFDELCAFEHPQVFRHRGKRHFIRRGEIADGRFALRETCEDAAAGDVGKGGESAVQVRRLIVNHMVYYGAVANSCQVKSLELKRGEQVAELVLLGAQVGSGMFAGSRAAGNTLYDANARLLELRHFVGVIRQ
jgi:hypothetical protein